MGHARDVLVGGRSDVGGTCNPWLSRSRRSFSAIKWFHSISSATSFSRSALITMSDTALPHRPNDSTSLAA